jgi:hypothetical protein
MRRRERSGGNRADLRGLERIRSRYLALTPAQRARFRTARDAFVADLQAGARFRPGLRVKRVQSRGQPIWEMTWMPDGRATFHYGDELRRGQPHIVWRRIGSHDIFRDP